MTIFEFIIKKLMERTRVDYFKLDIKEYATKFHEMYEKYQIRDNDKKTEINTRILDLMNAWSDKNIEDKNFTYATIILFADEFKVKSLEQLMEKAESQNAEDENFVDWFKNEAQTIIKRKQQECDNI